MEYLDQRKQQYQWRWWTDGDLDRCCVAGAEGVTDLVDEAVRTVIVRARCIVERAILVVLDDVPDPSKHVAHFHVTRGWGLANVLAALQAGITHFESTLGGIGGQPANFVDGIPVTGTGEYYYQDPGIVGLVSTEDMVVMMDEMGIDTGVDVDSVLRIGRMLEKIVGRRLRSESVHSGRIQKGLTELL